MSELQPTEVSKDGAEARLQKLNLAMCGGMDLQSYLDEIRAQGESQCTNVWSKGIIAYRCRTCQTNDSSAICVECFQNGNHWKHDYVMYHSESGGCCDCGDPAAWKELGFCSTHQRLHVQEAKVKDELVRATHDAVRYVLKELLAWVKKLYEKLSNRISSSEPETGSDETMATIYLKWSLKICSVDALRSIVCKDMIEYQVPYQSDSSTSPLDILLDGLGWMPESIIEAETTLFLQLLYKNDFKDQFLNILKGKYEEMIILAVNSETYRKNYKHLDTNLDRVMVQLFNDPGMTTDLVYRYNLLELFIGVFSRVISCSAENELQAVNVKSVAVKDKVYLRPQGDLRLIVSHGDVAARMLSEQPHLFSNILDVLVKLQWINPYSRSDEDIEFENFWTLAIQLEMNSMAIVFQLISRCYQNSEVKEDTLIRAATYTLKALKVYLQQAKRINERDEDCTLSRHPVSLHIPLHRTFSAILQKLVLLPWDECERGFFTALISPDNHDLERLTEEEVLLLMEHPLRILVWMAQIRAQMWRSTSEEFSRLELIYRGSFWHDQSMDMDILLIQFCTVALENLQETIFIKIAEQFDFKEMATSRLTPKGRRPSQIALLQDFMRLILLIVRERRNLGRTALEEAEDKCLQYDVIQWLCVRDQTYSQLCRALSAVPMEHHKLNAMLDKVAIYHTPKVAERGYYQLKPEYWKEFDPLFAHYYLNELEDAEDRAVKVGRRDHYWRISAPPAAGAPYDRLSGLLHTKACHMFLLNVLDEVRCLVKESTTATAGEALGVTALQMMAVLVSDSRDNIRNAASKIHVPEGPLDEFPTEDISFNIDFPIRMDSSNSLQTPATIRQMVEGLVDANDCRRLVDSVNHVRELLCLSTNEKSHTSEVDTYGNEDLQRRLLKEQRQKAILEEFAAKRNAFMKDLDVSDDEDDSEEGSKEDFQMKVTESAHENFSFNIFDDSASGKLSKNVLPIAEAIDYASTETSSVTKECVLCKRKKDDKNSSTCWIALVQRYNFPCQMLNRWEPVDTASDATSALCSDQSFDVRMNDEDLAQLVTVGISGASEAATSIDFSTIEHVQCCGHQMHFDCFHGHMQNLQLNPSGNAVVDASKTEFQCPICRRLANALLPDVEAFLSSRKLDLCEDGKGSEETGKSWSKFWQSNNNLERAVDGFCEQVLRVQEQSLRLSEDPNKFKISQTLWEGLVLNVVHCEVETRDGNMKIDSASSSAAPIRLSEECTWGGDSAHWIALRELGRLAMLSNTLPGAVRKKDDLLQKLRACLGLLNSRETLLKSETGIESSPNMTGISELEKIIREIFPQNSLCSEENSEVLELAVISTVDQHCQDKTPILQENPVSTPLPWVISVKDSEEELAPINIASMHRSVLEESKDELAPINIAPMHRSVLEESKDSCFVDPKRAEPHHGAHHGAPAAPISVPSVFPLQKYDFKDGCLLESPVEEANVPNCYPQPSSSEQRLGSSRDALDKRRNWIVDIMNNGVLSADPLMLLMLLLIIFNGRPSRRSLHSMVKFAYTAAVLQTQKAVTRLGVEGSVVETLVQRACLPFLRRAAMLVQIITREDFRGQHGISGTKVMEFNSLQLALQLPDCTQILLPHVQGAKEILATELLALHQRVPNTFTFELRKVPRKALLHKLPEVFQELLLVNIHNKKVCFYCKKMPEDPAICLICGMLLCCNAECCRYEGIGQCSRHAAGESAGVGIFLLLRSTQLLLLRNNRTCMGLSLYLDMHGEPAQEDLYLRRSQLLYLSDLRLTEVRRLWMTAAFDYDSYILRNSLSKLNVY